MLLALPAAGVGAIDNFLPATFPAFTPSEGAFAGGTLFAWEVCFADGFIVAAHRK